MSAYSTDDALTWSVPAVVVPNTFPTLGVNEFVNVSTDGQGNWIAVLAAARRANGSDSDIYAIRSADNGATWTSPEPVNPDAESDSADDSWPAITTDGHGRWMVAWRRRAKGSNDADILVAQSIDNGTTWSTSVPANLYSRTGERQDYLPVIVTDGRAVWLAAWIGGKHGLRLAF